MLPLIHNRYFPLYDAAWCQLSCVDLISIGNAVGVAIASQLRQRLSRTGNEVALLEIFS